MEYEYANTEERTTTKSLKRKKFYNVYKRGGYARIKHGKWKKIETKPK